MLASLEPEEGCCVHCESTGYGCVEAGKEAVRHFRALFAGLRAVLNGLGNEPPTHAADRRRNLLDDAVVLRPVQQRLQDIRNIPCAQLSAAEPDRADFPCESALARAAHEALLVPWPDPCALRRFEHKDRRAYRGLFLERPGRLDQPPHRLCDRIDLLASEGGGVDRQPLAHVVEKLLKGGLPLCGGRRAQDGRGSELLIVPGQIFDVLVFGANEAELFEIRISEAPSPALIDPETKLQPFTEHGFRVLPCLSFQPGVFQPLFGATDKRSIRKETERCLNPSADLGLGY